MIKLLRFSAMMVTSFAITFILASNNDYEWKNVLIGGGGFVDGIIFHPAAKGILYARTDVGGAYRWNTTNNSWIPLNDWTKRAANDDMGILGIGLDNNDTGKLYLMTGMYTAWWGSTKTKVMSSSDGGRTFSQQTTVHSKSGGNWDGRGAGERIAVDPNLGSIIFLSTQMWDSSGNNGTSIIRFRGALWKSSNSGKTFDSVKTGPTGDGLFVLFDISSGTKGSATKDIYASFDSSNSGKPAIWRSRDEGATWNLLSGQPQGLLATNGAVAGKNIFFSFNNGPGPNGVTLGAVWRFNTQSESWTEISPVKNPTFGFGTISAYARSPGFLVVSTVDKWAGGDEVWVSYDTGATWNAKLSNGQLDNSYASWSKIRSPHWLASIQYDPFDSTIAVFGTGYGVFRTKNLLTASPTWSFDNAGLEEIVALQLISPPAGAPLLSAVGDQGGFRHVALDKTPSTTLMPDCGTSRSIDVAWLKPNVFVKAHDKKITNGGQTHASISTDSGKTWTGFATQPPVQEQTAANNWNGGGGSWSIAISADASSILWSPVGPDAPYISQNNGTTWTKVTGTDFDTSAMRYGARPAADRVNAKRMYLANAAKGTFFYSTDGGNTFTKGSTKFDAMADWEASQVSVATVPDREGDVWATWGHIWSNPRGLYHSVNGGSSFSNISNVTDAWHVTFGKAAPGKTYPAIFIDGVVSGDTGVFISIDSALTWKKINDQAHQYGRLGHITGDPNFFGRVYISAGARGIVYGQPVSTSIENSQTKSILNNSSVGIFRRGMMLTCKNENITLFNLHGKAIQKSQLVNGIHHLNLSSLPSGIYRAQNSKGVVPVAILR